MVQRRKMTTAIGVHGAPPEFADWFSGKRAMPITALAEPYSDMLPALWADYSRRIRRPRCLPVLPRTRTSSGTSGSSRRPLQRSR